MSSRPEPDPADSRPGVLLLIRGLGPGGAERLLVNQAASSNGKYRYHAAYQVPGKDQLVGELEAHGVVVHRLPEGVAAFAALRALVRDERIDLVHSHSPALATLARLALRLAPGGGRPRLAYTEHNRWQAYRVPTRVANAVTYGLEDRVLAVSEEARRSVVGPLRRAVQTLHHGVDLAAVRGAAADPAATRATLGIADGDGLFVQVANFRPEKAHDVLVDTAAELRRRQAPVRILMVGQGPRRAAIEDLIEARGLTDTIEVLGFRDDVASLVAAADALVLSSDHEGLPVAVMEALALGTPVVATAVGGLPEAVEDGRSGLLVAPRDPVALADAIERLISEDGLRDGLSRGARLAASGFDAATATAVVEGLYADLVG